MGVYITSADILIPDTLKTYLNTVPGSIDAAILQAESKLNVSLIEGNHPMPLSSANITAHIKGICISLAMYYLYMMSPQKIAPDPILNDLKMREVELLSIANGGNLGVPIKNSGDAQPLSVTFGRG